MQNNLNLLLNLKKKVFYELNCENYNFNYKYKLESKIIIILNQTSIIQIYLSYKLIL